MASLTIVIPTRERCDTLVATLASCTSQGFQDLTILVVDNCSTDMTEKVVSSFYDNRIRYVNTGRRLAMSANWEYAFSHVQSDYVMFLGDDDAVLPDAAAELMKLVDIYPEIDAISWPSIEYGWPSCTVDELRSVVIIPLTRGLERRSARNVLSEVISFKRPYAELPFIYKGLVRTRVVQDLREASGGSVFNSICPDVYFCVAVCAVMDDYLFSYRPYTLNGASAHSNGTSTFAGPEAKAAERKFLSEDNLPFHPALRLCPSIPVVLIESLLQAKERLPVLASYFSGFDMMVKASVIQAERASPSVFAAVLSALKEVASCNALGVEAKTILSNARNRPFQPAKTVFGLDWIRKRYLANCDEFGIRDCYGASILANTILNIYEHDSLSKAAGFVNLLRICKRYLKKRI